MEEKFENDIIYYIEQLKNLEVMLENCDPENDNTADLIDLQNYLRVLLTETQDQLLEIKKNRLLESLNVELTTSVSPICIDSDEEDSGGVEDDFELVLAPYDKGFGRPEYHTAVIVDGGYSGKVNDENSKVIYTHPCYHDMVFCEKFLQKSCDDNSNCRFSHGTLVETNQLQPLSNELFSSIDKNKICLVKASDDGLWEKGRITEVFGEIIQVDLNSKAINEPLLLEKDSVWFFIDANENFTEEPLDKLPQQVVAGASEEIYSYSDSTVGSSFADKMMQKMGYVPGKGLGKSLQGITEPIHAIKAPKGTSLDSFVKMKACGHLKSLNSLHGEKTVPKLLPPKRNKVINVINNMTKTPVAGKSKKTLPSFKARLDRNSKNLNLQVYQIGEDIKDQRNEIASIQGSIKRNSQDKRYTDKLKIKLSAAQSTLERMLADEQQIKAQLDKSILNKKMASFK